MHKNLITAVVFQIQCNKRHIMKILQLLLLTLIRQSNSVVYLRVKNERGPAAWAAGAKCLNKIMTTYFYSRYDTRTKNAVILHTKTMSTPAAEIERIFLRWLNIMISTGDILDPYQLTVISDNYNIDGLKNVPTNALTLTDYYILVADDVDKVVYN